MKKNALIIGFMLFSLILGGSVAMAGYPDKAITYIIPFNPGGESDITARLQEPVLEKVLDVPINVTHKPGGGGAVAWSEFQRRAKPDGYTFIGVNIPHIIAQPILRKGAGYTTDGFNVVMWFQFTPNTLMVPINSPHKTLDDLIKFAKKHPMAVTIGGSGSNSANHLETLRLAKMADVKLTYIPQTGTGALVPALLGGHIAGAMSYSMLGVQYKEKVRVLAVAAEERLDTMPDAPTFRELGYDIVGGAYRGIAVPKGTSPEIIDKLAKAFTETNKKVAPKQAPLGFVLTYVTGDKANALTEQIKQNYAKIIEELKSKKK